MAALVAGCSGGVVDAPPWDAAGDHAQETAPLPEAGEDAPAPGDAQPEADPLDAGVDVEAEAAMLGGYCNGASCGVNGFPGPAAKAMVSWCVQNNVDPPFAFECPRPNGDQMEALLTEAGYTNQCVFLCSNLDISLNACPKLGGVCKNFGDPPGYGDASVCVPVMK